MSDYSSILIGDVDATTRACTGTADAESDGFFSQLMNGLVAPFKADTTYMNSKATMWTAIGYGAAGLIAGGYITRGRAAAGQEPIGGFLF